MDPERRDESRPEGDHETAYGLFQRGEALLGRRHHAQAAIVLERAARLEPGKASILEALGRAYYNSGQHERARATFASLLEIDPSAHYAHYAAGQSLKRLGRTREARTHLRIAVALSPDTSLYRGALDRLGPPPEATEVGSPAPVESPEPVHGPEAPGGGPEPGAGPPRGAGSEQGEGPGRGDGPGTSGSGESERGATAED
jgi:tetratricopeptide (TPR) repeat protein